MSTSSSNQRAPLRADVADLVIIDTEASGLDPLRHSLLSLAMVDFSGEHQIEIFVREPSIEADPAAMAVNRIDLGWLQEHGLPPQEACDRVEAWLDSLGRGRPLLCVGHNIAFDLAFMRRLYWLAGRPLPRDFSHRSIDTHSLLFARAAAGQLPPSVRSSDGAFAHFGIAPPPDLRHTALGDTLATRELLLRLLAMDAAP